MKTKKVSFTFDERSLTSVEELKPENFHKIVLENPKTGETKILYIHKNIRALDGADDGGAA